jgi:uncharacterized membrane protein
MSWLKTVAWSFMVLLAVAVGAYALSYFVFPDMIDPEFKKRFDVIPWSARLHIIPGGLALILGAFQFHSGLRNRWTSIHRNSGRAYVILVLTGAVGGLLLAWYAPHSPATRLGFASLAVVWFYSGSMAYLAIRAGNITLHRQWMIRSYSLTLAAVTLRIQLPIYQEAMGLSFDEAYAIVAWFSWIPNLVIAEWFINQTPVRSSLKTT